MAHDRRPSPGGAVHKVQVGAPDGRGRLGATPRKRRIIGLDRRLFLGATAVVLLAACGKKGEPEAPGGGKTPATSYPKPDPVPWQTPPQQKK